MHDDDGAPVLAGVFLAIIIISAVALLDFSGCEANHKEAATLSAQAYAAELGWEAQAISCVNQDSDGDGYVSCTIVVAGEEKHVECVGDTDWDSERTGCRQPKEK